MSEMIAGQTSEKRLRVGFCGSGEYSMRCAEALRRDARFSFEWVVTPPVKPAGRGKQPKVPALTQWAQKHQIQRFTVDSKLTALQPTLESASELDFLVVVSFGYLVPEWLLALPKVAPVNVHPSALPRYRGSSPGQFAVLYGEMQSSVSIMVMNPQFDEGNVITQLPFSLTTNETQESYYERAFQLAQEKLPDVLAQYAENQESKPQPTLTSETVLARRLSRQDGFLPFSFWELAQTAGNLPVKESEKQALSPVLQELLQHQPELTRAELVDRAVRAFTPWPGVWTVVPEYKGKSEVRLKIWSVRIDNPMGNVVPQQVQYEGETVRSI